MERHEILSLSEKINAEDFENSRLYLEKFCDVSTGQYESFELKKAISDKSPVLIKGHFLIGYDEDGSFVDINEQKIKIDRMVKAVVIDGIKESSPVEIAKESRDDFAIIGKTEWEDISMFKSVFCSLKVGEIFLPPHSAIFNFCKPTDEQKKKKIVSMLAGVNINIYDESNHIDNAIHEIGHLFWRDCLNKEEKEQFEKLFRVLRPSAIFEYEWEKSNAEEVFCTIYKWYVKSILLNPSFYNILSFEEPNGLWLLQDAMTRIARDRQVEDIWHGYKNEIKEYLNPKFDQTTGKFLRKAGALDRIKDIEVPAKMIESAVEYNGMKLIRMEKALVPIAGNKIDYENAKLRITEDMLEKAAEQKSKPKRKKEAKPMTIMEKAKKFLGYEPEIIVRKRVRKYTRKEKLENGKWKYFYD